MESEQVNKIRNRSRIENLTGQRFGRLMVLALACLAEYTAKRITWMCLCDCGKVLPVSASNLKSNHTKSCGCFRAESSSIRNGKHRKKNTPEYATWSHLRGRCLNPNNKGYSDYGGRGITVCARWDSFENFLIDMGERPSIKHSIDRINNNKGYEPNNCRWATSQEQNNNRRNVKQYFLKGESLSLAQISKKYRIHYTKLYARIITFRWCLDCSVNITENGGTCEHKS